MVGVARFGTAIHGEAEGAGLGRLMPPWLFGHPQRPLPPQLFLSSQLLPRGMLLHRLGVVDGLLVRARQVGHGEGADTGRGHNDPIALACATAVLWRTRVVLFTPV